MVIVLTGTATSDRSTLGRTLASELGWPFIDGDDHQPPANLAKIRRGLPLTRPDRDAWIQRLRAFPERLTDRREHAVVACSALEDVDCRTLSFGLKPIRFVHLTSTTRLESQRTPSVAVSDAKLRSGRPQRPQQTDHGIRIEVPTDPSGNSKPLATVVGLIRLEFGL